MMLVRKTGEMNSLADSPSFSVIFRNMSVHTNNIIWAGRFFVVSFGSVVLYCVVLS